jgi:hypothetical protein
MVLRHAHRDHILFNVFPEMYTCVEPRRDNVHAAVIGSDVEHDVRVVSREDRLYKKPGYGLIDLETPRGGT